MALSPNLVAETQPVLVAGTTLSLRQWEVWLRDRDPSAAAAWFSPPLITFERWLTETWEAVVSEHAQPPGLISRGQAGALWTEVVSGSEVGRGLISARSAAAWAADAWSRLGAWEIDPARLAADELQIDHRAALGWYRGYEQRLRDSNWIDAVGVLRELNDGRPLPQCNAMLLDPDAGRPPARRRFYERLRHAGGSIESWPETAIAAHCQFGQLDDPAAELARAAEWSRELLLRSPTARIALVLPELEERQAEVRAQLAAVLDEVGTAATAAPQELYWLEYGPRLDEVPAFGAAVSALELLSAQGGFTALSRWLRSPFFRCDDAAEPARRAAFEAELRGELIAQLRFVDAYRRHGLRGRVRRTLPATATAFDAALAELAMGAQSAAPTEWAAVWQACLRELGWIGPGLGTTVESVAAWDRALAQFAELTPVLGSIAADRALAEFRRLLRENRVQAPMPTRGLLVFDHPGKIGAGFDAAWITGFSDRRWPEPVALNPLLSRKLQVANAMPRATPQLAYAESLRQLKWLARRVPALNFSAPARVDDRVVEPSRMLRELDHVPLPAAAKAASGAAAAVTDVAAEDVVPAARSGPSATPRQLEELKDPAPAFRGDRIRGGARTLDQQAACPLRAFCESRLGARELEPLTRGLSPKLRGIVTHAALEYLYLGQTGAARFDAQACRARVGESVDRALASAIPWTSAPWNTVLRLERARMHQVLDTLLRLEGDRAGFAVSEVERRVEIRIADRTLRCRIDRADELEDGSLAVLDYKTGTAGSVKDWFRDRLQSTQLPLYALELGDRVSALVLVMLDDRSVEYRGTARDPELVAGKIVSLPDGSSWEAQLERWRGQIGELVAEYAAGDLRVFVDATGPAEGAYAPLTRIYELMGEAHRPLSEPTS